VLKALTRGGALNTKILFDLARLGVVGDASEISSVMVNESHNGMGIMIGTPGLVIRRGYKDDGDKTQVLFTYPAAPGINTHYCTVARKSDLTLLNDCFLHNHRIITVPTFDSSKIKSINEYVNQKGALSLTIERIARITGTVGQASSKAATNFVDKLYDIINRYRYNSTLYVKVNDGYTASDTDDVGYTITFISLHNCIPVFNPKRLDGMFMLINMYEKDKSRTVGMMSSIMTVGIVLSNYEDNVFVVDGVRILGNQLFDKKTITRLKKIIELNAQIKTKNKKSKSKKEHIIQFSNAGASIQYSSASTSGHYSASNTNTYYYRTS
jgi:hypothetical protein